MRLIAIIYFLFSQILSYSQRTNIEGHWRRIDLAQTFKDSSLHPGDFLLRSDSTFTMVGQDNISEMEIEGWHTGETIKGTWELSKSTLSLKIEDLRIPVGFKILRVTHKKMVFVFPSLRSTKMKFVRIKDFG